MARINIEDIKEALQPDNWTLISETYKNLDSNLEFRCNEGHTVIAPWKKIRDARICPTCMRASLKTKEFRNTKKKKSEYRILALDQATHISGYAVFSNKQLIDYGIFEAQGDNDIIRSVQIKQWLISLIDQYEIDFVGLEGIQYQAAAGVTTFETLARLQGILMAACQEEKIPYKVVNTNTWRLHCGVKGKTRVDKKRSMQLLAKGWYGIMPTDDEADALGIGKYYCDTQTPRIEIVDWEEL